MVVLCMIASLHPKGNKYFRCSIQNECDSTVQNSGVEDGYHSNWMHVGGGIKLVQGTVVDDVYAGSAVISIKEDLLPIMAPVNLWILAFRLLSNIMKSWKMRFWDGHIVPKDAILTASSSPPLVCVPEL